MNPAFIPTFLLRHPFSLLFTISIFLTCSACMEVQYEYFINQDGSGKVRINAAVVNENRAVQGSFGIGEDYGENKTGKQDSLDAIKNINEIISKSKGVRAWDSVHFGFSDSGKNYLYHLVAYFEDIRKLSLHKFPHFKVKTLSKKGMSWHISMDDDSFDAGEMPDGNPFKSNTYSEDPEVDQIIDQIQEGYRSQQTMLNIIGQSFRVLTTYHLPYAIKETRRLKQEGERKVTLDFKGDDFFDDFEQVIENEEKLRELIKEHDLREFDIKDPGLMESVFPGKSFMEVNFRSGWFSPSGKDYFNFNQAVNPIKDKNPIIRLNQ